MSEAKPSPEMDDIAGVQTGGAWGGKPCFGETVSRSLVGVTRCISRRPFGPALPRTLVG